MIKNKLIAGVLCSLLLGSGFVTNATTQEGQIIEVASASSYSNPSKEEIEAKIERVAIKYGIPPVVLKSIAYVESDMQQFKNGQPYIYGNSYGILQVTPHPSDGLTYDSDRLKYDIDYNIEMGARLIRTKWDYAFSEGWSVSKVGTMDPRVLENWYFTLWAYNTWSSKNNPNTNSNAYQLKVINAAKKYYGQDITPVSTGVLPSSGMPDSKKTYPAPENTHLIDFIDARVGYVVKDISSNYTGKNSTLKNSPSGSVIGEVSPSDTLEIVQGPNVYKGDLYYRVEVTKSNGEIADGWVNLKKAEKIN